MTDPLQHARPLTPVPSQGPAGTAAAPGGAPRARPRRTRPPRRSEASELVELARTIDLEGAAGPSALVEPLRAALRADEACLVGLEHGVDGFAVSFACTTRGLAAAPARIEAMLARRTPRLGFFDLASPDQAQQNAALTFRELAALRPEATAEVCSVLASLGLGDHDLLRALVCAHGEVLAWAGAFRLEPFGASERATLREVVAPLRDRVAVERRLREGGAAAVGLAAALEALSGAAFLVRRGGIVVHANAAGRRLLERDASVRRLLCDAGADRFAITLLDAPGLPPHWLAVERTASASLPARIAAAADRWQLTPRETQVLAQVAQGLCNKDVAAALGCAEATAERHVTALLEKSGCDHRAAIVARLWTLR